MVQSLKIYDTLSRQKKDFQPLNPPFVGMYVCGPTVYGEAHLGHARSAITFDTVFRYLTHLKYRVRYVRNITDVGHLSDEVAGEGEDRIAKRARLEQLEPMEVVQYYTNRYHADMAALNTWPPSIEPRASGHITEQIGMIEAILANGFAYEVNGSVYFDVNKYQEANGSYGELSGRVIDDLMTGTRTLDGQSEKRNPLDFALWKRASPEHLMRWPSPWSEGFPGWHLECSVMGGKYLGTQFDIHGGGMDLMFPHHECEIAQSKASHGEAPVRYWMHNNMITINGQKMGRSLNNFINLHQFFSGDHELLDQAYTPMTIRFFVLQAHYRSTLDFSNEALVAARKGYKKMMNGLLALHKLDYPAEEETLNLKLAQQITQLCDQCYQGMNDDFNTAVTIAALFNLVKRINSFAVNPETIGTVSRATFERMKETFGTFVTEVLGLREERAEDQTTLISALLEMYREAKASKAYDRVDRIRADFRQQGLIIKDTKQGVEWAYEE
ncbi:cysteinyl-tRNA synthetase [Catalinimonas alkaloidigena]|uniref:Cysteine--tRNA ligase n=1 Tax=Catalinimonas alkaloidigena TaxID=1075417 RepID=A0A1G9F0Q4_9BACT|nr:cysteine--tRNA ligase [Catalinimonas alkaloidigena]SDK81853.1 cysteinyl-tRNA synthetase [Catalinimonas alkaloidigena]